MKSLILPIRSAPIRWQVLPALFALALPITGVAAEHEFDTGVIKVVLGKTQGGFLDEVYLDRNGDGTYSPDELIVQQPAGEPGIVVSYIAGPATAGNGVVTGNLIPGKASLGRIEMRGLEAVIHGKLAFASQDSTPFEIGIRGRKGSAVLHVDFAFAPLRKASDLSLKEASLRVYGNFDARDPGVARREMSSGVFRNTPRPNASYQPLVWQLGGQLVESPWYWRKWVAWSEDTGPVTTGEGAVPTKELTFFMRDDNQGIQAAVNEPAAAAPIELAGIGLPANLGLYAWSPRVRALPMQKNLPERLELRNVGLHFFNTDAAALAKQRDKYRKRVEEVLAASSREVLRELPPVHSNWHDPRLAADLREQRLAKLAAMPTRAWQAEIQATALPERAPAAVGKAETGKGWLSIELDGPAGAPGPPLPARGGIPFPRGALKSPEHLRLITANNREIPVQADRLAVWPDGSVKWVLLTFLAGEAERQGKLRLEYGPEIQRKAVASARLAITRTGDGLRIDTGPLRFALNKQSAGLFDDLWLAAGRGGKAEPVIRGTAASDRPNRMDILALAAPAGYAPYAYHAEGGQPQPSRAEVEDIGVEREGPLVAHLLVKGRYRYDQLGRGRDRNYRNEGCEFWLRYTVYAGQSYVELKHSFVFEGNPDIEMIQDLSLSVPLEPGRPGAATIGLNGKASGPYQARGVGIFQDNPHAAELWTAEGADERVRAMGATADGWIDVGGAGPGVTFGLGNMREMYAKELSVQDGRIRVSLWPRRARLLDTRRYARQYGDGESTSYGRGEAEGVSRSHDLFFYFHGGDAAVAASAAVARGLRQPLFVKAPPAWYAESRAAGEFRPRDAAGYGAWERLIADGFDYFLYHRQLWSWFGIYDYGDFQQVPDGRGGWARLAGRWGWANNEALIDMALYEQFMRTGLRDYLDAALALTRHTQEVDLINSNDYKGNRKVKMYGHRHNVNHWGDGYIGIRVAAPQGFRLGYFLTGDLRILDQLRMGMDAHWESMHTYDKEHGAGLGYLTFFWEATGEPLYRDALAAYLDFQVGHFRKFGNLHKDAWNFRKDIHRPLPDAPLSASPTDFFFQNFGSAYSLMELAELTGRSDLVEALVQYARDTMRQRSGTWEAYYCHHRLMAFAYRHTGDPAFLGFATEKAAKLTVSPNRQSWSGSSAIGAFDNKLSMLAWTAQGLPYLMRAIDVRAGDPVVAFSIPKVLPIPQGKTRAPLRVDAGETHAREGGLSVLEWQIDGRKASNSVRDTLSLPAGKHQITLIARDNAGRDAAASRSITVWEPGVVAQLCFRGNVDGFMGGEYSDAKGYGYLRGSRLIESSEPRRQGNKGCPEVLVTGGVRVRTGPGRFTVEMGGADFWTENMGRIVLQGRPLDVAITRAGAKKLSWSYAGEVTVGSDGVLTVNFEPGPKGEPVVLAYIIVHEARR